MFRGGKRERSACQVWVDGKAVLEMGDLGKFGETGVERANMDTCGS